MRIVARILAAWALLALLALPTPLDAAESLPGPIPARVIRVPDGDTIFVRAQIWLGQEIVTSVRLALIDAPEIKGKCEAEKARAQAAQAKLAELVEGQQLMLVRIVYDKFGGRVRANVLVGRQDVSRLMLAARDRDGLPLVRPYRGGKREGWCG